MTQDIKDLAAMMGTQFPEAVKLAEKADAEEIGSIIKSMDQSYQMYSASMNEAARVREELLNKLSEVANNEAKAVDLYVDEKAKLRSRLEAFKKAKLGTKVSDEAVAQRARTNGTVGITS